MEKAAAVIASIDLIKSAIDKLGSLDRSSSTNTQIRDDVIKSVHNITNGLRECIAHLDSGLRNTNLARTHGEIRKMKDRLVNIRNELHTGHTTIAKAYAEGGDNRDNAHLIMLELGTLVDGIKGIAF